jgi:FG-GAP repeat
MKLNKRLFRLVLLTAPCLLIHICVQSHAAPIELYQVPGELLTTADGKFAVRTTSHNEYWRRSIAAVTIFDVATGNELLKVTSQQVIDTLPEATNDDFSVAMIHSGFGASASIAREHLVVGSPGGTSYCDCSIDPPIEELGRPGRAFVFNLPKGIGPIEVAAPDLSRLRNDDFNNAELNWMSFGNDITTAGSMAIIQGRGFNLASGEELFNLHAAVGYRNPVASSAGSAIIGHPWSGADFHGEVSVYDLQSRMRRSRIIPLDSEAYDRFGDAVAMDGNFAIVGAPGNHAREPGKAYLIDVDSGQVLMRFNAADSGVADFQGADSFGRAVAIDGDFALIGAPYDSALNHHNGAAYLFDIHTGELLKKILPTSPQHAGGFGSNVALADGFILIEDYFGSAQFSTIHVYAIPEPGTIGLAVVAIGLLSRTRRLRFRA